MTPAEAEAAQAFKIPMPARQRRCLLLIVLALEDMDNFMEPPEGGVLQDPRSNSKRRLSRKMRRKNVRHSRTYRRGSITSRSSSRYCGRPLWSGIVAAGAIPRTWERGA